MKNLKEYQNHTQIARVETRKGENPGLLFIMKDQVSTISGREYTIFVGLGVLRIMFGKALKPSEVIARATSIAFDHLPEGEKLSNGIICGKKTHINLNELLLCGNGLEELRQTANAESLDDLYDIELEAADARAQQAIEQRRIQVSNREDLI